MSKIINTELDILTIDFEPTIENLIGYGYQDYLVVPEALENEKFLKVVEGKVISFTPPKTKADIEQEFIKDMDTPINIGGFEIKPKYRDLFLDMYNTLDNGFMTTYNVKTSTGALVEVNIDQMRQLLTALCPIVDGIYNKKHQAELEL